MPPSIPSVLVSSPSSREGPPPRHNDPLLGPGSGGGQHGSTTPSSSSSSGPSGPTPGSVAKPSDSIILEEEIDPNYVPTEDEVLEYATWLGMDLQSDADLFWIAKEGLKAPLPENWKPCKTTDTDEIYYFNFATGESTWDHPCDEYYRTLYEKSKKTKLEQEKAGADKKKQQAKKDVDKMLGKNADDGSQKLRGVVGGKAGVVSTLGKVQQSGGGSSSAASSSSGSNDATTRGGGGSSSSSGLSPRMSSDSSGAGNGNNNGNQPPPLPGLMASGGAAFDRKPLPGISGGGAPLAPFEKKPLGSSSSITDSAAASAAREESKNGDDYNSNKNGKQSSTDRERSKDNRKSEKEGKKKKKSKSSEEKDGDDASRSSGDNNNSTRDGRPASASSDRQPRPSSTSSSRRSVDSDDRSASPTSSSSRARPSSRGAGSDNNSNNRSRSPINNRGHAGTTAERDRSSSPKQRDGSRSDSRASISNHRDDDESEDRRREDDRERRRRREQLESKWAEEIAQAEKAHAEEMDAIEKRKSKEIKNATTRADQRLESKEKELKRQHEERVAALESTYEKELAEEEKKLNNDKKNHVRQLRAEIEEQVRQVEGELQNDLSRSEKRYKDTQVAEKMKVKALEDEMEKTNKGLEQKRKKLQQDLDEVQASHEKKMKLLRAEIEDSETSAAGTAELRKKLAAAEAKVSALTDDENASRLQLEKAIAQEARVAKESKVYSVKVKVLEGKVDDLEDLVGRLKRQKTEVEEDLDALKKEGTVAANDDEVAKKLQRENTQLNGKIADLKARHDEEVEELKGRLRESNEKLIRLQMNLDETADMLSEIKSDKANLEDAVAAYKKAGTASSTVSTPASSFEESGGGDERGASSKRNASGSGSAPPGSGSRSGTFKGPETDVSGNKKHKTSFSALLASGKAWSVKRRLVLGNGSSSGGSKQRSSAMGSGSGSAESSHARPGLGSGSIDMQIAPGGQLKSKPTIKVDPSPVVDSSSSSGEQAKPRAQGSGSGSAKGGSRSGSSETVGTTVVAELPLASPYAVVAEKSYSAADFRNPENGSLASGTLVVQSDPSDYLDDAKKTKRFLINAAGEICRALKLSPSTVTLSNLRPYPILVDITIDTASAADLMASLVPLCNEAGSALKTGGSGVLSKVVALVPLLPSPATAAPPPAVAPAVAPVVVPDVSSSAEAEKTISSLNSEIMRSEEAKRQLNDKVARLEKDREAVQIKLDSALANLDQLTIDVSNARDEAARATARVAQSQRLIETNVDSADSRNSQLMKDLEDVRKREDESATKLIASQRDASALQHQLTAVKREMETLRIALSDNEKRASESNAANAAMALEHLAAKNELRQLKAQVKRDELEHADLLSRAQLGEGEVQSLRARVQVLLKSSSEGKAISVSSGNLKGGDDTVNEMLTKLSSAVAELSAVQDRLSDSQNKLKESQSRVNILTTEKQSYEEWLERLKAEVASGESEKKALRASMFTMEGNLRSAKLLSDDLESKALGQNSDKIAMKGVQERNKRELDDLEKSWRTAKNLLSDEEQKTRSLEREVALLDAQVARMSRDREEADARERSSRDESETFKLKSKTMSSELEASRAEQQTLKSRLAENKEEVVQLRADLETVKEKLVAKEEEAEKHKLQLLPFQLAAQQQQQQAMQALKPPPPPVDNVFDKALRDKVEYLEAETIRLQQQVSQQAAARAAEAKEQQQQQQQPEVVVVQRVAKVEGAVKVAAETAVDSDEDKTFWDAKVSEEKKLLDEAKKLVREQKVSLKKKQQEIEDVKDKWRRRRNQMDPSDNRGMWDLKDSKRNIDKQADVLNQLVQRLRKTQIWLSSRETKVASLEDVVRKMIDLKKSSGPTTGGNGKDDDASALEESSDNDGSIIGHVRELQRLSDDLEYDASVAAGTGLDSAGADGGSSGERSDDDRRAFSRKGSSSRGGGRDWAGPNPLELQQAQNPNLFYQQYPTSQPATSSTYVAWGPGGVLHERSNPQNLVGGGGVGGGLTMGMCGSHMYASRSSSVPAVPAAVKEANVRSFQSQLKDWTRERIAAQREVAHHVSWLDELRNELTTQCYAKGGGGYGGEGVDENFIGLSSRGANAILSPRLDKKVGGLKLKGDKSLFPREV